MVKFGALVSLAFAAAMLAGCSSGSQNQLPLGSSATVQSPMTMGADSCLSKGGVRVTPCKVVLTASQPGPDTVTLRTPHGSKGSVDEHDTCGGASGKATITQVSTDTWQVTAGAEAGDCHAKFNYFNNGQRVGWAYLKIENMI
ncbi:MAG: hypothetical protein WBE30_03595 [Candidatus Cybelea sp.]|jgi:hypothetical protein